MRITVRDRELVVFVAAHRLVLAAHVQALLRLSGAAAYARLHSLSAGGFLSHRRVFHGQPGCYQVTRTGLALIESDLPPPRLDLRSYRHDVGVAWLWLAARAGTWGPMRQVLAERDLRSHDGKPDRRDEPFAIRLGGVGPGGRERLHYPDVLLVTTDGRRIALELELSSKGRARRERILTGYAVDRRIDAVAYLTDDVSVARAVRTSAAGLGVGDRVHVQWVKQPEADARADASAVACRTRAPIDAGARTASGRRTSIKAGDVTGRGEQARSGVAET